MNVNFHELSVNFSIIDIFFNLRSIYDNLRSTQNEFISVNVNDRELTGNFRNKIFSLICGTFSVIRVLNIIILEQYSYCGLSIGIH